MKKRMVSLLLVVVLMFAAAIPASAASLPFSDVPVNAWYLDALNYVYNRNLMLGTSATKFSPNTNLKREEAVEIIGRIYEASTGTTISINQTNPFTDAQDRTKVYYKYVGWAYSKGIIGGTSSTTFGTGRDIMRKDLALMLWNFQYKLGRSPIMYYSPPQYSDIGSLDATYRNAIDACYIYNIMIGYNGGTTFKPNNYLTRAEMAQTTYNICVNQRWL